MYYNGKKVPIKSFQDYCEQYLGPKDTGVPRVYERFSDRWEVCIATTDGQMNQVCAGEREGDGEEGGMLGVCLLGLCGSGCVHELGSVVRYAYV